MNFSPSDKSLQNKKVGWIGMGNIGQSILSAFMESGTLQADQVFIHNRTPGKAKKMKDRFQVKILETPEQIIEKSDIIILATKPQDLFDLLEPLRSTFDEKKVIISLAAGINLCSLKKYVGPSSLVRLMLNTPVFVHKAVIGFCLDKPNQTLESLIKKLFSPLGYVVFTKEGEEFSSITVAVASGTGFILEIMQYWQDWLQEHGLKPEVARKMVIHTFLGTAQLAERKSKLDFDQLAQKVASKKGVTDAGLKSMRELELEGILRMSFNKALMREREIAEENR